MQKNILKITFLLFQIFIFFFLWIFWPSDLDSYSSKGAKISDETPDYSVHKLHYFHIQSSQVLLDLHGTQGRMGLRDDSIEVDHVSADIFPYQDVPTKISSRSAFIDLKTGKMYLKDEVHLKMQNHISVQGSSLLYDFNAKKIFSSEDINIFSEGNNMDLKAKSMEASVENKSILVRDAVRIFYNPPSSSEIRITGDEAVLFQEEDKVWIKEQVRLSQDKLFLKSDELFLYYKKRAKDRERLDASSRSPKINYLMARGNVEIQDLKDRLSKSEKAEFFSSGDLIVLSGSPVVYDGSDVLTGERLVLYRKKGVVEIESTNATFEDMKKIAEESKTSIPGKNDVESIELELGE